MHRHAKASTSFHAPRPDATAPFPRMRRPSPRLGKGVASALFLAAGLLSGCTSYSTEPNRVEMIRAGLGKAAPAAIPRFAALAETPTDALQIAITQQQRSAVLLRESRVQGIETFLSPNGVGLMLDAGIVVGTRGLGEGLLGSDVSETRALVLARRGGSADRLMTYLDGNDRAVTRSFRCSVSDAGDQPLQIGSHQLNTRVMAEDCQTPDRSFRNFYFVEDASGRIVQSQQWVGPYIGEIATRVVLP